MKKILFSLALFCASMFSFAQTPLETKVSELEKKVDALTTQTSGLSQRLSEVEQMNIRLRKAHDFGKPITSIEGQYGISYHLTAVEGDKANKTITVRMQVASVLENRILSFNLFSEKGSIVDMFGDRYVASSSNIGGESNLVMYKDVPINATVVFEDIDFEKVQEIKLFVATMFVNTADASVSGDDVLQFRDLKVNWK